MRAFEFFWPEGGKEICDDRVERILLLVVHNLSINTKRGISEIG